MDRKAPKRTRPGIFEETSSDESDTGSPSRRRSRTTAPLIRSSSSDASDSCSPSPRSSLPVTSTRTEPRLVIQYGAEDFQHTSIPQIPPVIAFSSQPLPTYLPLLSRANFRVPQSLMHTAQTISGPYSSASNMPPGWVRQQLNMERHRQHMTNRPSTSGGRILTIILRPIPDSIPNTLTSSMREYEPNETFVFNTKPATSSQIHDCTNEERYPPQSINRDDDCAICLSEFSSSDTLRTLKCKHAYHRICIDEWLKSCGDCPICRTNI